MPFPLILPLAASAVKTSASVLAWYWGLAAAFGSGAGVIYLWSRNQNTVIKPIRHPGTALHAMKEKIEGVTAEVLQNQYQLSELDEHAQAELEQAKMAYEELINLFEKLKSGLSNAKELEETIERMTKIIGKDSATLDVLQQKILNLEKMLSPVQKYSLFSSSECKQHQLDMKSMVERMEEHSLAQAHGV